MLDLSSIQIGGQHSDYFQLSTLQNISVFFFTQTNKASSLNLIYFFSIDFGTIWRYLLAFLLLASFDLFELGMCTWIVGWYKMVPAKLDGNMNGICDWNGIICGDDWNGDFSKVIGWRAEVKKGRSFKVLLVIGAAAATKLPLAIAIEGSILLVLLLLWLLFAIGIWLTITLQISFFFSGFFAYYCCCSCRCWFYDFVFVVLDYEARRYL